MDRLGRDLKIELIRDLLMNGLWGMRERKEIPRYRSLVGTPHYRAVLGDSGFSP